MPVLETLALAENEIAVWIEDLGSIDFGKTTIRHFDVSNNRSLGMPPVEFLRQSNVNKIDLSGCNVDKGELMRDMDRNGVKEY